MPGPGPVSGPRPMTGLPGKLRRLVARLGWGAAAGYLLHRAARGATGGWADLHCYRLVLQPVWERPLLAERWRGDVSVRQLGPGDPEIGDALSRRHELAARLARGDACLAAFRRNRVVGYLWLCFGGFDDDETDCRFTLPPGGGGAWDYDLWIAPELRGSVVFAALWQEAWGLLRQKGYRWTASRVSAFNDQSLRAHRRLGAREAGTILVLRAGRGRLALASVGPRLRLYGAGHPSALVPVDAPRTAGGPGRAGPPASGA